jgi:tetratricopeptide (TPR) repeat protein
MLAHGDDDHVKLMDFGISKTMTGQVAATITKTGQVIGTPQYMAPEQVADAEVDHRADIYAVGLTLFAMLTGETPFGDVTFTELVAIKLRDRAPSLAERRPGLPRGLLAAVMKSLEREPEHRFSSAQDFADALRAIDLADRAPVETLRTVAESPSAKQATPTEVNSSRSLRSIGIVVALAAIAAVVLVLATRRDSRPGATLPPDAARIVVVPPIDAAAEDPLELARIAERQGQLELALSLYVRAFDAAPDANVIFRIGELNERLDRRSDAIAAFERYLALVPSALDATATTTRIQRLRGPTPSDDAAVEPTKSKAKPKTRCACVAQNDPTWGGAYLCRKKVAPRCKCVDHWSYTLCPEKFELCPDCTDPAFTQDGEKYTCTVDPLYNTYHLPGVPGTKCAGWSDSYRDSERKTGMYECDACSDYVFSGTTGDACRAFTRDGDALTGKLDCNPKYQLR